MKKILILSLAVLLLIPAGCHREKPADTEALTGLLTIEPNYRPITGLPERQSRRIEATAGKREMTSDGTQTAIIAEIDPDTPESFTLELKSTGKMDYYLYAPRENTEGMSLIIYLHGSSMRLAKTEQLLTSEAFPLYLQRGDLGDLAAYIAIPKLTEAYQDWSQAAEDIREMIDIIHRDYAIALDHVALTGHSLGGSGAYQLAIRLPGCFACIAPLSGGVACSDGNLSALAKTRIWSFIGTADTVIDPEMSRQLIKALQKMGADARITELPDATHRDLPSLAYRGSELMQWMISGGQ